jgi:hypothetical protein
MVISVMRITVVLIIILGVAAGLAAQEANTVAGNAAIVKAMDNAMDPGEGQKKLEFLVGTFDVKIRTWIDPSKPPIESIGVAVHTWVLGKRYVQTNLSAFVMGQPFNAIGYAGFDNVAKQYVACYMDDGSTGMEWYTGVLGPDGKLAKMTATIHDAITQKPTTLEMRVSIAPNGDHVTELWQGDRSGKMIKIIELQYTRKNS